MSSANDIVTKAMRRLGLLANGESPSARDEADGIDTLNSMVASWATKGVRVADDLPLGAEHDKGIIALLAVDIAGNFGMDPPAAVTRDADAGWNGLQADYFRVPMSQFDSPLLTNLGQGESERGFPALWRPQQAYSVGDVVMWEGRVYECSIAGSSGATVGPTGRTSATDGTVTWTFLRVI